MSVELKVDGTLTLDTWSEYAFESDFLTPADAFSVTIATDAQWARIRDRVVPDAPFEARVDGALQCTGWIDSVSASTSAAGTTITIAGRDTLRSLVDANVHPDTPFRNVTVAQLVETMLAQVYRDDVPALFTDNEANRSLIVGRKSTGKSKAAGKEKERLDYVRPHAGEGAFAFIARNVKRFGLWLWATADGNVVLSSPTYDQPVACAIKRELGGTDVQVLSAAYTQDLTSVPSHIFVRGKAGGKYEARDAPRGSKERLDARVWRPMYVTHDTATTGAQALAFAVQEMTAKLADAERYECTLRGHSDPRTGAVYAIDTVVRVKDDVLGIDRDMWVASRSFKRSASGATTTRLKLLPLGAIQFSEVDAP